MHIDPAVNHITVDRVNLLSIVVALLRVAIFRSVVRRSLTQIRKPVSRFFSSTKMLRRTPLLRSKLISSTNAFNGAPVGVALKVDTIETVTAKYNAGND
jgi:hypothetical protein